MNTTTSFVRFATPLMLAALILSAACSRAETPQASAASATSPPAAGSTQVVTDIANWRHPAKAVFVKYDVKLQSVTVKDGFATFQVEFPFDPQTEPNTAKMQALCLELLKANGSWAYALVSTQDHVEIDVSWDKKTHRISIGNHPV